MKILIATGRLAEQTVRDAVGDRADILVADTQIAAFITPRKLLKAIKDDSSNFDYDLIFISGLVSGNFEKAEKELDCKIRLGPKHAYDLDFILPFTETMDFSTEIPACELLADVRRTMAIEKIEELENAADCPLELRGMKIGGSSRMKVLAEVVDATGLDPEALELRIRSFEMKGADMIDLGASLHAGPYDVKRAINIARRTTDLPLSIDTLDPVLIREALNCGIDMVLSLDGSNISEIASEIAAHGIPAVVIPDQGGGYDSLMKNIELARKAGVEKLIADPVLDPIGHGIASSIVGYMEFHEKNPDIPVFYGIGNVTELIDVDSTGVNATLCGIGAEVGASILFTPEYSNKTQGSINELKRASQMMILAKERESSPKDLGIDLIEIKEKRRRTDSVLPDLFVNAEKNKMWTVDPKGSIRISIIPDRFGLKDGSILAEHDSVSIVGKNAREVMDTILNMELVSRMEHAAYLGQELKKAELALKLGRSYAQDDEF
ncbi:dihydropteroate synthase-like protein [Methanolobus bombayensis]|uniref:dihydropteroate synthase-like protein n=1 Tax=Methanolobus bombayensis TaxID=38023 RepID=UPI001AE23326|nr:dihydropteroate synthase-like protein [Methanolobus bombayensis]MBP1909997.1 dihydropteroate synthase-like protein [Methanolobus bombayensis]